ncbi:UNVERIFIED_CONTAM: hypothetical protein NCL1_42335 [Trichonephila clavipes]
MVCGAISYDERSNVLRIEGNLNSNRYVREVLQPEVVLFLQGSPGAIFKQDNASPHLVGVSLVIRILQFQLLLRVQAIWNSLPQADIQNLFDSMPRRIAAIIAARRGYTKY